MRLDNLGDVLLCTPAIHAIRDTAPEARITLLAGPVGAQVGNLDDDVDETIVYSSPWMDAWGVQPQDSRRELQVIEDLRRRRFDGAVIFTSYRQSSLPAAYLAYLADIPLRLASSIDGSGSLLTTRHKHVERLIHEVERALELVALEGFVSRQRDLVLQVPWRHRQRIRAQFARVGLSDAGPKIVIHPGCSMPARTYSWQQYAAAADLLIKRLDAQVIFTGVASEVGLVKSIQGRMRRSSHSFAGKTSLVDLAALIAESDVVITNNTGPAHVAAAVKTPIVSLFALTNPPEQWRPWMVEQRVLNHPVPCALCYSRICPTDHTCLRAVTASEIVEAAHELLAARAPEGVTEAYP